MDLLLQERREQNLPGPEMDEALLVPAEQAMKQGRSAAGVSDDEDRILDIDLSAAGKEEAVDPQADRVDHGPEREERENQEMRQQALWGSAYR